MAASIGFFAHGRARARHPPAPGRSELPGKQTREPLGAFHRATFSQRCPPMYGSFLPRPIRVRTLDGGVRCVGSCLRSTTGLELALQVSPVSSPAARTIEARASPTMRLRGRLRELLDEVLFEPSAGVPVSSWFGGMRTVSSSDPRWTRRASSSTPGTCAHHRADLDELAPGRNDSVDRICDGIRGSATSCRPPQASGLRRNEALHAVVEPVGLRHVLTMRQLEGRCRAAMRSPNGRLKNAPDCSGS